MNLEEMAYRIHQTAQAHGFWDKQRNTGEMLMLVVSELAEALEEDRAGNPPVYFKCVKCNMDFIPLEPSGERALLPKHCDVPAKPEGEFVEICDAIIRLLDMGQNLALRSGYRIADVLTTKMAFNDQREHMHGKAY